MISLKVIAIRIPVKQEGLGIPRFFPFQYRNFWYLLATSNKISIVNALMNFQSLNFVGILNICMYVHSRRFGLLKWIHFLSKCIMAVTKPIQERVFISCIWVGINTCHQESAFVQRIASSMGLLSMWLHSSAMHILVVRHAVMWTDGREHEIRPRTSEKERAQCVPGFTTAISTSNGPSTEVLVDTDLSWICLKPVPRRKDRSERELGRDRRAGARRLKPKQPLPTSLRVSRDSD